MSDERGSDRGVPGWRQLGPGFAIFTAFGVIGLIAFAKGITDGSTFGVVIGALAAIGGFWMVFGAWRARQRLIKQRSPR